MKKAQMIGATIGLISFLLGFMILRNFELPEFVSYSLIIFGVLLFFKIAYTRFGPKVALFGGLAFFVTACKYVVTNLFLRQNPLLVSGILMFLTVLSIIFIGLSLYYMFKDMKRIIK